MMGKVSNEPPIMDVYFYMFIQPYYLGRGPTGDNKLWYNQMVLFPFSSLSSFFLPFRSPKALPAASKALPDTFVILSDLAAASKAFSATFEALSAAPEALPAASEALSAASGALSAEFEALQGARGPPSCL